MNNVRLNERQYQRMQSTQICQQRSLALDLARINNMRIRTTNDQQHELVFELKGWVEYVQHPATLAWEKEMLFEEIKLVYDSFEMAAGYFREWVECLEQYQPHM